MIEFGVSISAETDIRRPCIEYIFHVAFAEL